jgi:hypothetical protein
MLAALAELAPSACDEIDFLDGLGVPDMRTLERIRDDDDKASLQAADKALNERPDLRELGSKAFLGGRAARGPSRSAIESAARRMRAGNLSVETLRGIFATDGYREAWEFLKPMFRHRIANCYALFEAFSGGPNAVDVFFPALVDFDHWIGDEPTRSSIEEQAAVMQRIARLTGYRVRPYLPFNPYADIKSSRYFPMLQRFAAGSEFVGFKLYPPMGFAPEGNGLLERPRWPSSWAASGIPDFGRKLDDSMRGFLGWCASHDTAVMAHANPSNGPDPNSLVLGNPEAWRMALDRPEARGLRLDAGHFGGDAANGSWRDGWAQLMKDHPGVFADLSYWEELLSPDAASAAGELAALLKTYPYLSERLMYGTDWSMLAIQPQWKTYRDTFVTFLGPVFGDALPLIMGGNARRFAGPRLPVRSAVSSASGGPASSHRDHAEQGEQSREQHHRPLG